MEADVRDWVMLSTSEEGEKRYVAKPKKTWLKLLFCLSTVPELLRQKGSRSLKALSFGRSLST